MFADDITSSFGSEAEALRTYQTGGLPKWVVRECLEGDQSSGYSVNSEKLSDLLSVVSHNANHGVNLIE